MVPSKRRPAFEELFPEERYVFMMMMMMVIMIMMMMMMMMMKNIITTFHRLHVPEKGGEQ